MPDINNILFQFSQALLGKDPESDGEGGLLFHSGNGAPTNGEAGYATGAWYFRTSNGTTYRNVGDNDSSSWELAGQA